MAFFNKNGTSGTSVNPEVNSGFPDLPLYDPTPPTGPSDGSTGVSSRSVTEFKDLLWSLGWADGRAGQPISDGEQLLRSRVDILRSQQIEELQGHIEQSKVEIEAGRQSSSESQEALKKASARAASVEAERADNRQEYSLVLGVIYLVVAAILLLSDIPLSLRLVAEGYNIPTEADVQGGLEEEQVFIGQIFVRPLLVFQYLWEPLLLALGIAASGIFVKIFVDEVIWRTGRQERPSWKVLVFMGLTALLFVFTLVAVGFFRSEQQAKESLGANSYNPSFAADQLAGSGAMEQEVKRDLWGFSSFLSITLMLPLIGGICFLSGWKRIQNWRFYRECLASLRVERSTHMEAQKALAEMEGGLALLMSKLSSLEVMRGGSGDPLVQFGQSLYRHGYWRGAAVPETMQGDANLYDRVERIVTKEMSVQARRNLWERSIQYDHSRGRVQ